MIECEITCTYVFMSEIYSCPMWTAGLFIFLYVNLVELFEMHVYSAVYVYKQYINGVLFTVNRGCRCVVESDINILIHYA